MVSWYIWYTYSIVVFKFCGFGYERFFLEAIFGMSDIVDRIDFQKSPFRCGQPTMTYRLTKPWLIFDWMYRLTGTAAKEDAQTFGMRTFTRNVIAARRCHVQIPRVDDTNSNNNMHCLLDFLLQLADSHPTTFTADDVVEEAITFMLAGQDAVGAALGCSIFLFAQNASCQQRARDEIDGIDRLANDDKTVSLYDRLRGMQYLERCINETLRLYPSVPLIARELGESLFISGGVTLPAGSSVLIFPYALHRLARFFPDAERFDPERRPDARHPYAFMPFSGGPRKCVGDRFAMLELQTILADILRRFDVLPVPGRSAVRPVFRVTLRATGGLWVRLRKRSGY